MNLSRVNAALDAVAAHAATARFSHAPPFLACGMTGFYAALIVAIAGGLIRGLSVALIGVLAVVSAASFYPYVFVRRWVIGREQMVRLDQVWIAEACATVALGKAIVGVRSGPRTASVLRSNALCINADTTGPSLAFSLISPASCRNRNIGRRWRGCSPRHHRHRRCRRFAAPTDRTQRRADATIKRASDALARASPQAMIAAPVRAAVLGARGQAPTVQTHEAPTR